MNKIEKSWIKQKTTIKFQLERSLYLKKSGEGADDTQRIILFNKYVIDFE